MNQEQIYFSEKKPNQTKYPLSIKDLEVGKKTKSWFLWSLYFGKRV